MRKEIGIGLTAVFLSLVAIGFNWIAIEWVRWALAGLFTVGALDSFFIGNKRLTPIGWLLIALGLLLGFHFGERWGALLGGVIGTLLLTPIINRKEIV